jgi:hypothetical protein
MINITVQHNSIMLRNLDTFVQSQQFHPSIIDNADLINFAFQVNVIQRILAVVHG